MDVDDVMMPSTTALLATISILLEEDRRLFDKKHESFSTLPANARNTSAFTFILSFIVW